MAYIPQCLLKPRLTLGWLLFLTLTLGGCSDAPSSTFQGYVEGEFVYVATSIAGRLDRLSVHRGQPITEATPLFALEATDELAGQRQAQHLLASTMFTWDNLKTGKRAPELDVIKAQIIQAIANEKKSAIQLARDEEQFAAGGIAKAQLDDSRYLHDADLAKVNEMTSQLASSKLPARADEIRSQAAQMAAARAALAQANWKLSQKSIVATRRGLVFDTLYREGEWVAAGNPVVQMLPPENIKVRFFVPEPLLGKLSINQAITLHIDGVKSPLKAHITYISTQAEYTPPVIYSNETRAKLTFMIEAHPAVENAPLLHPGQPVRVTL